MHSFCDSSVVFQGLEFPRPHAFYDADGLGLRLLYKLCFLADASYSGDRSRSPPSLASLFPAPQRPPPPNTTTSTGSNSGPNFEIQVQLPQTLLHATPRYTIPHRTRLELSKFVPPRLKREGLDRGPTRAVVVPPVPG